ncbi:MAG: 16S rRNA (cytosine(1402)-N(4))-methyltransferase RsmH [Muribaculaceae bacterium]
MTTTYHTPALYDDCMIGLNINPEGIYVDATFGGGGHSRGIITHLSDRGHLYCFDQDLDAYANYVDDKRSTFVHSNFAFMANFLRYYGVSAVDGILADLGVSFHHFDDETRGFSFRFEGPLDMRMNQSGTKDAQSVIANYSEEQLANMFYLYGELKQSRRIAAALVKARNTQPITTVQQLLSVVKPFIKPKNEKQELAQVFQALRIEVNDEMAALKALLQQSLKMLKSGGRVAIITYHSLEDRMVKNFFRSGNVDGTVEKDFYGRVSTPFKLVNNKVIVPSAEEVERNPRSRSAKLRIAQKL